jgi:hypothetical protein
MIMPIKLKQTIRVRFTHLTRIVLFRKTRINILPHPARKEPLETQLHQRNRSDGINYILNNFLPQHAGLYN